MRPRSVYKRGLSFLAILSFLYLLNYYFVSRVDDVEVVYNSRDSTTLPECSPAHTLPITVAKNEKVVCKIDDVASGNCVKDRDEVYFPFSLLKKHLDVSGRWRGDAFEWRTSYAKMRLPDTTYNSTGPFGHFGTYNVEHRDRVRCINPLTGVPMSTQWDTTPYYYPIQIAQYGLQHYSKLMTSHGEKEKAHVVGEASREWKGVPGGLGDTSERVFFTHEDGRSMLNITTNEEVSNPGVYISLWKDVKGGIVSFSLLPHSPNVSFSILVSLVDSNQLVMLHYVPEDDPRCVWSEEGSNMADHQMTFHYSLPLRVGEWMNVSRDVLVDVSRALSADKKKSDNVLFHPGDVTLEMLAFRGVLTVHQRVLQSSEAHENFFLAAADWLLHNQESDGGWSVPVQRSIMDGRLVLAPGWHSAMIQGHALSTLTRAFFLSSRSEYLQAARSALRLFEQNVSSGGVVNEMLGVRWYEEYPTSPASFVLNGFMYSLVGLFDYSQLSDHTVLPSEFASSLASARRLFDEGVASLKTLLPLFDTGSGSTYDLRHFSLHSPPNLARWDYHAVHVYLLKWLVSITGDEQLDKVADRWIAYANGKRAKHN